MRLLNKITSKIILIAFLLIATVNCTTSEEQAVTNLKNLVIQDEFDVDGEIDSSFWTAEIGNGANGWGNNELQYYTDRPENVLIQDGNLHIIARKEAYNGFQYTSARLVTKAKFEKTYGRYEARIKLPWGQGVWPAFWLLGANHDDVIWPACGEIDIMEYRGQEPTINHGSLHGPGYSAGEAVTHSYTLENDRYDTDFHIFGIEWGAGYVNFYVDDVLYNQITPDDVPGEWVYDHPFYIIMNVAIGGNYPGNPNQDTVFPQTMLVDYVRVYD